MPLSRLDSLRDFLRVWFHWKRQAILIFLIIVVMVMGFAYLATPLYEATAKVVILPKTAEGALISSGSDEYRVSAVSQQDMNTEIELLYSTEVLHDTITSFMEEGKALGLTKPSRSFIDKAVDLFKLGLKEVLVFLRLKERLSPFEAKVALLGSAIEVEPIAMSNMIIVTLEAESPKAAAVVLNRLLDVYIQHQGRVYTQDEGVQFYTDQAEKFKEKLALAEDQLRSFQTQNSIVDLERQNSANIDQLTKITDNLQNAEVSTAEIQSAITMLKAGLSNGVTVTREIKKIPAIAELDRALVPLYIEKSEILKHYTKNSREYRNLEDQIHALQMEIRNEVQKAIQTEELELGSLVAKKGSLKVELEKLQSASNGISQKKKQLNELKREVELYEKNYKLYSSKKEDALIYSDRKNRNLANISVGDRAEIPPKASFPNRLLFLVLSIFIGTVAALGSPFVLEFLDHRIKFPHDVEKFLAMPVICSISNEDATNS